MDLKTRIIGDLHIQDRYPGQLEAQINALGELLEENAYIVLLGDVFEKRQPSPKELLAFQECLRICSFNCHSINILRGNHDSQTKSDDGLTALSLFESENIYITPQTKYLKGCDPDLDIIGIPHYEEEKRIIKDLANVKSNQICVGHFGFNGCLNSTGDSDFSIPLSSFISKTYLGHIHSYNKPNEMVTVVGTPYSTSFQESGKQNYVIDIIDGVEKLTQINYGPRFLTIEFTKLKESKKYIEDKNYYTFLRVLIGSISENNKINIGKEIEKIVKVPYYEIKFIPSIETDKEISSYIPDKRLLEINEDIIKDYVNSNLSNLPYNEIMEGYNLLR